MALIYTSWLLELVAVLAIFIAGLYVYYRIQFQYWKKKGVPYPEPSFIFGNISDLVFLRKSIGEVYMQIYKKMCNHKMVGVYQLSSPNLMIADPDLIKTFLVKDFSHFHDHGSYFDEKIDPLSGQLFMIEGTKWKHMRYKLVPTFTSGKMKMMFPAVVECGIQMQEYMAPFAKCEDTIEDVKKIITKYNTDVIATCAFGIQTNCIKNTDTEFEKMGRKIFKPSLTGFIRTHLALFHPKLAAYFKLMAFPIETSNFFRGIVKETVTYRETNNVTRNDFMELLIKIKNKKPIINDADESELNHTFDASEVNYYDVHGMTIDEVAAQAFAFFTAGMEASTNATSFCLYELALNQDVQDNVHNEIDSVLVDNEGQLTYDSVASMTYLDNVIAETLRKYPPAPTLTRICTKEYKVPDSDLIIEKGTPIVIPVLALHYDEKYFPDPEKFQPDRFTAEEKSQRHHFAYIPFGEGPRICIGSRFALMQFKVALVTLLTKYRFSTCSKTAIPLKIDPRGIVLMAEGGINLKISMRH